MSFSTLRASVGDRQMIISCKLLSAIFWFTIVRPASMILGLILLGVTCHADRRIALVRFVPASSISSFIFSGISSFIISSRLSLNIFQAVFLTK